MSPEAAWSDPLWQPARLLGVVARLVLERVRKFSTVVLLLAAMAQAGRQRPARMQAGQAGLRAAAQP